MSGNDRAVRPRWARRVRRFAGFFYVSMGGVHLGIVAADPEFYRAFADQAVLSFVEAGWREIFMAHPRFWGLIMAVGETGLGTLLLAEGRAARLGLAGAIAFHLLLVLFGWGYLLWSIPVLAALVPATVQEWPHLGPHAKTWRSPQ